MPSLPRRRLPGAHLLHPSRGNLGSHSPSATRLKSTLPPEYRLWSFAPKQRLHFTIGVSALVEGVLLRLATDCQDPPEKREAEVPPEALVGVVNALAPARAAGPAPAPAGAAAASSAAAGEAGAAPPMAASRAAFDAAVDRLEGPLPLPVLFALFPFELVLVFAFVSEFMAVDLVVIGCRAERWGFCFVVFGRLPMGVNLPSKNSDDARRMLSRVIAGLQCQR